MGLRALFQPFCVWNPPPVPNIWRNPVLCQFHIILWYTSRTNSGSNIYTHLSTYYDLCTFLLCNPMYLSSPKAGFLTCHRLTCQCHHFTGAQFSAPTCDVPIFTLIYKLYRHPYSLSMSLLAEMGHVHPPLTSVRLIGYWNNLGDRTLRGHPISVQSPGINL